MNRTPRLAFSIALLLLMTTHGVSASNQLSIGFASGIAGDNALLPVNFINDGTITGLQFDISYPPQQLEMNLAVNGTALSNHEQSSWLVSSVDINGDGIIDQSTFRVIITPTESVTLVNSGTLVNIPVRILTSASYSPLILSNIIYATSVATEVLPRRVINGAVGDATLDSDGDGFADYLDAFPNNVNETLDTDGDGIGNNQDTDDDNDGLPDSYEIAHGLDPHNFQDSDSDLDNDGLSNFEEYQLGTDPTLADTDGDGMSDGEELSVGRNPLLNEPAIIIIINNLILN